MATQTSGDTKTVAHELTCRGVTCAIAGDLATAVADFDRALQIDPQSAEAFNNRGFVRQVRGDATGARADYDAALVIDPKLASALANRGGLRLAQWDVEGALQDLHAAVAIDPTHRPARLLRANAIYHTRDVAATEADYQAAFALDAAYTARTIVEQIIDAVRRDVKFVLTDCEQHLRYNAGDIHSLARRGLVHLLQSRDAEAEGDFTQYRSLNAPGVKFLDMLIEEAKRRRSGSTNKT